MSPNIDTRRFSWLFALHGMAQEYLRLHLSWRESEEIVLSERFNSAVTAGTSCL